VEVSLRKVTDLVRQQTAAALETALDASQPMARAFTDNFRKGHPDGSPADALRRLEWMYRASVTSTGAAAGLTAVAPNPVAWAATIGEAGAFLATSAFFVVASAEIHGIKDLDPLQRRVLVTGILLGDAGASAVGTAIPRTAKHWGKLLVGNVPRESLLAINKVLGPNFVTKYGTKQGVLVLGREAPLGIGAVIGGAGNAVFGETTIRAAHKALGPVGEGWDA
jgi:hypothetical protein